MPIVDFSFSLGITSIVVVRNFIIMRLFKHILHGPRAEGEHARGKCIATARKTRHESNDDRIAPGENRKWLFA